MLYKVKEKEPKNLFILELENKNGITCCRNKIRNILNTNDVILFLNEEKKYSYFGSKIALKFLHKGSIVWIDKKDIEEVL